MGHEICTKSSRVADARDNNIPSRILSFFSGMREPGPELCDRMNRASYIGDQTDCGGYLWLQLV